MAKPRAAACCGAHLYSQHSRTRDKRVSEFKNSLDSVVNFRIPRTAERDFVSERNKIK